MHSIRVTWDPLLPPELEVYRALLAGMGRGLVIQASSGAIVACNQQAERLLGLTYEQMVGRTSLDPRWRALRVDGSSFPGEEHPAMVSLRTGERVTGAIMGVSLPDGRLTWISIDTEPLRRADGSGVFAVATLFEDVTERLTAANELEQVVAERSRLAEDLRHTLDRLRSLAKVLPVCASCKGVRDERGDWQRLEAFLIDRVGREVSHGLCPGCLERLYPEPGGDPSGPPRS